MTVVQPHGFLDVMHADLVQHSIYYRSLPFSMRDMRSL
jgi:hypothetical protein